MTEFIPDILDAESPIIFPFAFKAPNTVREVNDPSEVIFACAAVWTVPDKLPVTLPIKDP